MAHCKATENIGLARKQFSELSEEFCRRRSESPPTAAIVHTPNSRSNHNNALNHTLDLMRRSVNEPLGVTLCMPNARHGTVFAPAFHWGRMFSHCARNAMLLSNDPADALLLDTERYADALLACMHPRKTR